MGATSKPLKNQPDNKLRKLVLLSWADSNFYENWTWEVFLTERPDGTISTGARQFGEDVPSVRLRGSYRIRTGLALRRAIERLLAHEVFQDLDWSWSRLLRKIERFHPTLAAETRAVLQQEREEERRQSEEQRRIYKLGAPVREWVARASWPRSNATGGGGMAGTVANARLTAGVTNCVQAFLDEHGHFPTGVHQIDQAIGDAAQAEKCAADRNGLGRAISAPGRVQLTVQFPEV